MKTIKLHTESFVEYSEKLDTHVEVETHFIIIGRGKKRQYVEIAGAGQYDIYDCSLVRNDLSYIHELIAVKSGEKPVETHYTSHTLIDTVKVV